MRNIRLGVNVDHVATLRQARRASYPDPVTAAAVAELGGADQITVHLREDRRHIQDRDLQLLRQTVQTRLNLEMAAVDEMVRVAQSVRPETCTLVPERRQEITTEGGLDAVARRDELARVTAALRDAGMGVSFFIDPEVEQVKASQRAGANIVEIHTGRYCDARGEGDRQRELQRVAGAAAAATSLGLAVAAGHGLHYANVMPIAAIPEIEELNIGHAIVARAVLVGLERAVREMKELMRQGAA
ncbi:MAG TPA: pyridoxine 5'-phosphate synthase [Anaeromyxobacteraceae bacterium]|nr:pyridoxine 5'-phosphate synthase [Anaeromyxobacteraceae bacterium]